MPHSSDAYPLSSLSAQIVGCAMTVLNTLGTGFLEKVYENALGHELRKAGLAVAQQESVAVLYDGIVVGAYVADLVVNGCAIVELKSVRALDTVHRAQCLNYLKATGLPLGLLINFGKPRLEVRRLVRTRPSR